MNSDDFRMSIRRFRSGVDIQLSGQPSKVLMLVERHVLVAEEYHLMLHQSIVNFLVGLVAERFGDIGPTDLRSDYGGNRFDIDCFVSHAAILSSG